MALDNMIKGLCPKCREPLSIPGHLKEFSCMYCGTRLTADLLLPLEEVEDTTTDTYADSCAAFYHDHVLDAISQYQGYEKQMTKSLFPDAFSRYQEGNAKTFRQLDTAIHADLLTLEQAVSDFLEQLEARWNGCSKKSSRSTMMETDRFILAIFMVPMIRQLKLSISEEYCAILHKRWMERYPKTPFNLGTYDDLTNGFKKKYFGLCFITTAVCRYDHKPDDCPELTAFRAFRDGYLRACPDGPDLIDEYYDVAPALVLHLELSGERDQMYRMIREDYLAPCYEDLLQGKLAQCKDRYVSMVRSLKEKYLN